MLNATGLRPVAKNKIQDNVREEASLRSAEGQKTRPAKLADLTKVDFHRKSIVKLVSSARGNPAFGRSYQTKKGAATKITSILA